MFGADALDEDSRAFLARLNANRAGLRGYDVRRLRLLERTARPPATAARSTLSSVADRTIPGPAGLLPVRIYRPQGGNGATLVYFHGGGFVLGDLDTHDGLCATLAAESGCVLVSVAYRLAPEHRFPAPLDDANAAFRFLVAHAKDFDIDPARLGVAGDSAGANLAANLCLMARDRGDRPPIALQVLLQPVTHRARRTPSEDLFASGFLLDRSLVDWFRSQSRPDGADPAWRYDAPFEAADHRNLPPAIIVTAGCDPLRDQGAEYAAALRRAGNAVRGRCYGGTIHDFMLHADAIPAGRRALRETAAAIRRYFAAGDVLEGEDAAAGGDADGITTL